MSVSYYDILGVPADAGQDEIKRAWRDAAERFEPGSGGSSAQFRLFNEAAEVLLDPERRREYDAQLAPAAGPTAPPTDETAEALPPSDTTQAQEVESGRTGTPPARRRVPIPVLAVLGLLAAVAVGLAAYFGFQAQRAEAYQEALDQAPAAAERAAVAVLSYDHESLDADRDAAAKFLAPDYRGKYVSTFDKTVKDTATQIKAKVEAEVLATSTMVDTKNNRDPEAVRVLIFVNQTTLSTANAEPQLALNRARFDMVKVDGTWLVGDITSY